MLGIMRFVLSILVLFSHSNHSGSTLNFGVVSVVIFYFISGCLMQRSFQRFMIHSRTPVADFYKDRLLKLFPQYVLVVCVTFLCFELMGPSQHVMFMNQSFGWERFFLNIALLPDNYVFNPFAIEGLLPHPVVPPAWSLSSEFHFYLIVPLLVFLSGRSFACLFFFVLCVQTCSLFFENAYFNSDNFGYRYTVGSLTFFLFGYCYSACEVSVHKVLLVGGWLLYAVLLMTAPVTHVFSHRFVPELLMGVLLSLPLVHLCMTKNIRWLERFPLGGYLGRLSYPIFISHFLAFYLCEKLFGLISDKQALYYPVVIFTCALIAVSLAFMQGFFDRFRFNSRGFASALKN